MVVVDDGLRMVKFLGRCGRDGGTVCGLVVAVMGMGDDDVVVVVVVAAVLVTTNG